MYTVNKNNMDIKNRIIDKMFKWSLSDEKFLNIVSPPYNFSEIFLKLIMFFIRNRKRVLYITNEKSHNIIIINDIIKYTNFINYTYYDGNKYSKKSPLVIVSSDKVKSINDRFDLVIYDDIKGFSDNTIEEVLEITLNLCKQHGKIITYFIEKIFHNNNEITFPIRDNFMPIIEPKFIETRIDINKDIPYVIYEYIKWSIKDNRKMIIFVPDENKVENVYKYLYKYCKDLTPNTIKYINGKSSSKVLYNIKDLNDCIVITNNISNIDFNFKSLNVMVFFADSEEFNYKKLVYLCGKVGINENRHTGEVIFLGNCETNDIDKAKKITRYFNKKAWEMNLLEI
ncbi:hypothetical protein Z968_06925 [Clostridium novyi A str. 4552]|uniref:Comf operon protein A, DNA transporter ATPase n=1 Tax=Clostridium novyi A str. 4552 TaxID=1444289 RepID=A0A0A0I9H7_CLONO|nr:hypothetical protein [Clostridium novyi]KGM96240.1 hypothetical protein Z968_06925 [Clostridium novyi A str. 4552]